jgi:hypothetical protein
MTNKQILQDVRSVMIRTRRQGLWSAVLQLQLLRARAVVQNQLSLFVATHIQHGYFGASRKVTLFLVVASVAPWSIVSGGNKVSDSVLEKHIGRLVNGCGLDVGCGARPDGRCGYFQLFVCDGQRLPRTF